MKSSKATVYFLQMLLTLLKGRISLAAALQVLCGEGIECHTRNYAITLLNMMRKGKKFSESLASIKSSRIYFNSLQLTMIGAAQSTGNIEAVLEQIIADLQIRIQSREKAINILIYPALVILLAITGTVLIITKGLPMLASAGILTDQIMAGSARGMGIAGIMLFLGGSILFIVYYKIFNVDSPEYRIFYMLNILLQGNMTLQESLSQCIAGIKNNRFRNLIVKLKKGISDGLSFSLAIKKLKHFTPYVSGWLAAAEEDGNLGGICSDIMKFYGSRDGRIREIAGRFMEPLVIILAGSYILVILLTVIMPVLVLSGGII